MNDFRNQLHDFLEKPTSKLAINFRFLIVLLILLSAGLAFTQLMWPELLLAYTSTIEQFEIIVLGIFTVEFLARLLAAKSLKKFSTHPSNWIDLMAILPFYLGLESAVILRLFRVLRLLKLVNSIKVLHLSSALSMKNSILRVVSPLVVIFAFLKGFLWMLESREIWKIETNFDMLFTIIGFALGVVLSQKVGKSFGKFITVQDSMYRLHGKLSSLQSNMNLMKPKSGDKIIRKWLEGYLHTYKEAEEGALAHTRQLNQEMYESASKIGNTEFIPFHRLAAMMSGLFEQAIYIQSKSRAKTPDAYNILLQQTTIFYLILIVLFVPGLKGMVSVVFAGYLLYGMYQITNDFDDVSEADLEKDNTSLIGLNAIRIKNYLVELQQLK